MQVVDGPDGERLDLAVISPADWGEIRKTKPPMRCRGCGGPAYAQERPYIERLPDGQATTRLVALFCHFPGEAERCRALGYEPESIEHAALKQSIAAAAEAAGQHAEFELIHDDGCRSDVVATSRRTGRREGFEVQVSPLSLPDALARQERYESHLDASSWLHPKERRWSFRVPSLRLGDTAITTVIDGIRIPPDEFPAEPMHVTDAVTKVLNNDIRHVWFAEDFGYFVPRPEAKVLPRVGAKQPKRPAEVRGQGTRFCERSTRLTLASDEAVIAAGFDSIAAFQQCHRTGTLRVQRGEALPSQLEHNEHQALLLARQFPELKTADPDRFEKLGILKGERA